MIDPTHSIGVLGVAEAEGRVLLVRTAYGESRWQLPGGFVEAGESLAEALQRELREELGAEVAVGSLVGLYLRRWDNNLVIVFRVGGNLSEIVADPAEVRDFGWFPRGSMPVPVSVRTKRMVNDALAGAEPVMVTFGDEMDPGT